MQEYYYIIHDDSAKNPIVPNKEELFNISEVFEGADSIYSVEMYFPYQGKLTTKWDDRNALLYEEGRKFQDYLACAIGWPVVSEKVKSIFQSLIDNSVQFLPIRIVNANTREINSSYFVLNSLTMVSNAIDLEHTQHVFVKGEQLLITDPKPKIIHDKVKDYNVFRIREYPYKLYLSKNIVNVLIQEKVTGCEFVRVIQV